MVAADGPLHTHDNHQQRALRVTAALLLPYRGGRYCLVRAYPVPAGPHALQFLAVRELTVCVLAPAAPPAAALHNTQVHISIHIRTYTHTQHTHTHIHTHTRTRTPTLFMYSCNCVHIVTGGFDFLA